VKVEPIVGRYAHIDDCRVYFEEAGQGIPLLCLHTAGSDGRQYRAVLNDSSITRNYRVIAFDMPWHGKSSPPAGWEKQDYRLTTDKYVGMVMGFARALGLERPVVMGCSIGGRIELELALRRPRLRRGGVRAHVAAQPGRIGAIDTSACPLYLLTGEYDYSASPRDTEAVAARVKGAKFTVMKGLGHFPMSENPEAFLGYLRPVLEEIAR
jgi:pimeloyl-ACP methyl ester carboxylesterase